MKKYKLTRRSLIKNIGMSSIVFAVPNSISDLVKINVMMKNKFDAVIIGGSYAGLSAAMALGRSLRNVLIIDSGRPCNIQTPYSHNFLTHDGIEPHLISQKAKGEVLEYDTIEFLQDHVIQASKEENEFEITTENGLNIKAKKLILATGIKDVMPEIKGFSDCWGISVIHCPYCHGYEFKEQKTAIMANGDTAYHMASLINNLTKDLTVLTNGKSSLTHEQIEKFNKRRIEVIETEIVGVEHVDGILKSVVFKNGNKMQFSAMYAALPFKQNTNVPIELGCKQTERGYIQVDDFQKTSVEGVFACGDNSTMMRSVANAVANGNIAGAMANMELVHEEF